jgi:orotate phosphoribosyltransferase
MNLGNETSEKVAEHLLQIKAVKLNISSPFTWASGLKSPIYCDNRKTLSYPVIRTYLRQEMVRMINIEFGAPDVIAGVATGGIALGALVAQEMGLPFVYVRSSAKEHGLGNTIEGVLDSGQSIVLIEDLVSTGKSSLSAVDAVRDAGSIVKGMVAIFTYGLPKAIDSFRKAQVPLVTLSDYDSLVRKALEHEFIEDSALDSLKLWKKDPQKWSDDHQ